MHNHSHIGQSISLWAIPIALMSIFFVTLVPSAFSADVSIGVMGASLSDEYAYNGRAYAENWVEQYAYQNGGPVNFGALGSYPSPRNEGYAYNWSLSGATSSEILSKQAPGLAAQIPSAGIQYVVLLGGGDDFAPNTAAFQGIYNGTWTQAQINAYVNQTISNIEGVVSTMPAGTKMVIATLSGFSNTPSTRAAYPNAAQLQLVDNALAQVNAGIQAIAQANHLVVADISSLSTVVFGTAANPNSVVEIGGVPIYLDEKTDSNPSNAAFVNDGVHPNTVIQGVLGNVIMDALDIAYNAGIPLFSEAQLLARQRLAYGGSDTLAAEIGPYSDYVENYVPEPSGFVLVAIGFAGVGAWSRRKRQR